MKIVVQRVKEAKVIVNKKIYNEIKQGFLIYVGIGNDDNREIVDKMVRKVINLRIMSDENDKMNLSLAQVNGSILAISQFTLYANTATGNRPSFTDAANHLKAQALYDYFVGELSKEIETKTGVFGEYMEIESTNDGPVTILIDL
ncbi:MAG: D-aminoacyl-tRNA deacylase [Acholeplasmataceae bacterium]